jgi:hypothetical protein
LIDPEQLLSQYEGKLAEAWARSDAIRENLANLHVTERSPDGQIAVTVNDAGDSGRPGADDGRPGQTGVRGGRREGDHGDDHRRRPGGPGRAADPPGGQGLLRILSRVPAPVAGTRLELSLVR